MIYDTSMLKTTVVNHLKPGDLLLEGGLFLVVGCVRRSEASNDAREWVEIKILTCTGRILRYTSSAELVNVYDLS